MKSKIAWCLRWRSTNLDRLSGCRGVVKEGCDKMWGSDIKRVNRGNGWATRVDDVEDEGGPFLVRLNTPFVSFLSCSCTISLGHPDLMDRLGESGSFCQRLLSSPPLEDVKGEGALSEPKEGQRGGGAEDHVRMSAGSGASDQWGRVAACIRFEYFRKYRLRCVVGGKIKRELKYEKIESGQRKGTLIREGMTMHA